MIGRTRVGALAALFLLAGGAYVGMATLAHDGSRAVSRGRVTSAVAGDDWQPLGPTLIALVADPANPSRLYEGTMAGVYRSTDTGRHWRQASIGLPGAAREVWSLTIIPGGSLVAATEAGVYRSTDGARHWRPAGLAQRAIYTLAARRASPAGHVVLLAGGDGGIFRSDDRGLHWRTVYNAGAEAVSALAWPSARPSLVMAGLNPGPRSIAVSLDGGGAWRREARGLPTRAGMMAIAVAPGGKAVYAGSMGLGVYVAADPTTAWRARTGGLPGLKTGDAHIGSFDVDPDHPATIYAATPAGVYHSTDMGMRWSLFGRGL